MGVPDFEARVLTITFFPLKFCARVELCAVYKQLTVLIHKLCGPYFGQKNQKIGDKILIQNLP